MESKSSSKTQLVIVSGIQPSGSLHIGNYFGAIRQHIELHAKHEAYYFIVNYHALTSLQDTEALSRFSRDVALDYLALGFDPDKASLCLQSDVPAVTELAWIFETLTPVSQLEKAVAYKDKLAQGMSANAGLFNYPVLQAADILIYGGTLVPVGADQKQNIEICRDLAQRFNDRFSPDDPVLVVPEPYIMKDVAIVPGIDGQKMSKSYGNTLDVFDDVKTQRKQIMRIQTDSRPVEEPKEPDDDHLYQLFSLFADEASRTEMAAMYRRGGFGYGDVKQAIAEAAEKYFAPVRARRARLVANPQQVAEMLAAGASRARKKAGEVLLRAQRACGLKSS